MKAATSEEVNKSAQSFSNNINKAIVVTAGAQGAGVGGGFTVGKANFSAKASVLSVQHGVNPSTGEQATSIKGVSISGN